MDRKTILRPMLLAFAVIALGVMAVVPSGPSVKAAVAAGTVVYQVKPGDSLFKIAVRYGITVEQLRKLNRLTSSEIYPGQTLVVSVPDSSPASGSGSGAGTETGTAVGPASGSGFFYTVRSGDTLYLLARRFGTTVSRITAANRLSSEWLWVGQVLYIPGANEAVPGDPPAGSTPVPPEPGAWQYTVVKGDTIFLLARRFDTTMDKLYALNGLKSDYLEPGMVLWIPASPAPPAPPALPAPPVSPGPPSSTGRFTQEEVDMIARLVQAEAGGEPYEGQVAVAAVVLNRLDDPRFPKTIAGIIYEPWAFESVENGWFNNPAGPTAYQATKDALAGADPTNGAVFFYNPVGTTNQFMLSRPVAVVIGNHVFAY